MKPRQSFLAETAILIETFFFGFRKQIKSLTVIAERDSLSQKGEHEQKSPVSKIINHPEYNRLGYMSSDIALLYLKHKIEFGK